MSGTDTPGSDDEALAGDATAQALAEGVEARQTGRTFATSMDVVSVDGTRVMVPEASGKSPVIGVVIPDSELIKDTSAALAGMGVEVTSDFGAQVPAQSTVTRGAIRNLGLPDDEDVILGGEE